MSCDTSLIYSWNTEMIQYEDWHTISFHHCSDAQQLPFVTMVTSIVHPKLPCVLSLIVNCVTRTNKLDCFSE